MEDNKIKVQWLTVKELQPYVNNPRKNDKAVEAVAASIQSFGFNVPITVDKDHVIVTGHTRLKAAIKLGMTEVPVIVLDNLDEAQVKAFRLADNKVGELADWDLDQLAVELEDLKNEIDMTEYGFEMEEQEADNVKEDDFVINPPAKPKAKIGDVYMLGGHRLMCGDSTNLEHIEKLMDFAEADCLITDPPYNVDYGELQKARLKVAPERFKGANDTPIENDKMTDEQFVGFMESTLGNADSVMRPGAAFYIWHATISDYATQQAMRNIGWQMRQILIWNKSSLCLGFSDYQWKHEPCFYGWKKGTHYFTSDRTQATVIEDQINIDKLKLAEAKDLLRKLLEPKEETTVLWEHKPLANSEHPTMKPVKLIARIMANSTKKGDIVLDIFGGSGTTIIAAEQLHRRCFMMEYDPKFVDVIIKRYEEFTGDKAVLLNDR